MVVEPMTVMTEFKYTDLVDIDAFTRLLDNFFTATGIPNGLVGTDGELISQAGWTDACHIFHRGDPESNRHCQESNLKLMRDLHGGEVAHDLCMNGLIDYATPVVIEGQQLATLFLGQVLTTPPDMEFFSKQAESYGYDKDAYLEAIRSVPVVTRERMESLMQCMVGMAQMLAASGLARLRQTVLEHDLSKSTEQRIQLEDILDSSPVGIGWSDMSGRIEYINHQFTQLFGYTLDDVPDVKTWYQKAYPDPYYRQTVIEPWEKAVVLARHSGVTPPELEVSVTTKDGKERRVLIRVSWVGEKRLVNFSDMSEHWQSELRNRAHDSMLEMVAKGAPLVDILHAIVNAIESEDPTALCSVLLLDNEGKHLLNGASPSLPDFYNDAINGIEIGMGVGSCGTAAYLGERVVVEEIMTHEYWKPYTQLAKSASLAACWSEPILSSDGKVLGTFAIYHTKPTKPQADDLERIGFAANIAAIAIENRSVHAELERRAYSDYLTGLANRRYFIEQAESELARRKRYDGELALIMFDIDHFKQVNDAHGHSIGDQVLQQIAVVCREILRDVDIVGRIGGEEFAVLLPQAGQKQAAIVAERLRMAVESSSLPLQDDESLRFTVSFGVAEVDEKIDNLDDLMIQADAALYLAKASGRNRTCVADEVDASCYPD